MLNSAIYPGQVYHRRFEPVEHTLRYRTFFLLIDLDELPELSKISRLFSYNRRNWFSFFPSDHGLLRDGKKFNSADSGNELRRQLSTLLQQHGLPRHRWHFRMLTMPRTLGYVFNPISLIYCYDEQQNLQAMIYEVNNTFDERTHYVRPVDHQARILQRCRKELFVSPFFNMDGFYHFDVARPGETVDFKIDYLDDNTLRLRANFVGRRIAFNAKSLRSLALHYSNTTYKVVVGIHWEAMKLWWKGLPIVNHVPLIKPDTMDDAVPTLAQGKLTNLPAKTKIAPSAPNKNP